MISSPARTSPALGLFVSSAAVETATTSSPAVQSSRCRSMGWSVANTSEATWSAILASPRAKWRAAATGSGAAPTARAARTIAAHHPWAWALIASKTSTDVVRAWSAMSAAASSRSIRSTSPRRTVMCPSSSGTNRVRGRSQRLSMSTRRLWGLAVSRWSMSRSDDGGRCVRVVHHDQTWHVVPVGGSVEQLSHSADVPRPVRVHPRRLGELGPGQVGLVVATDSLQPGRHPERLARARGRHEQRHGRLGRPVELVGQPSARHVGARQPGQVRVGPLENSRTPTPRCSFLCACASSAAPLPEETVRRTREDGARSADEPDRVHPTSVEEPGWHLDRGRGARRRHKNSPPDREPNGSKRPSAAPPLEQTLSGRPSRELSPRPGSKDPSSVLVRGSPPGPGGRPAHESPRPGPGDPRRSARHAAARLRCRAALDVPPGDRRRSRAPAGPRCRERARSRIFSTKSGSSPVRRSRWAAAPAPAPTAAPATGLSRTNPTRAPHMAPRPAAFAARCSTGRIRGSGSCGIHMIVAASWTRIASCSARARRCSSPVPAPNAVG